MNATPKPGKSRNIATPARESQNETPLSPCIAPLDTAARKAHHARAAATSAARVRSLKSQRQTSRIHAVSVCIPLPLWAAGGGGRMPAGFVVASLLTRPLPPSMRLEALAGITATTKGVTP